MADLFDFMAEQKSKHAVLRRPDTLERGVKYEVFDAFQIPDKKNGNPDDLLLVLHIYDDDLKFYVYMPKKFKNMTQERFQYLKDMIHGTDKVKKQTIYIVFYGKLGLGNVVEILRPGEEINQKLVDKLKKVESTMSPIRGNFGPGQSDYGNSPTRSGTFSPARSGTFSPARSGTMSPAGSETLSPACRGFEALGPVVEEGTSGVKRKLDSEDQAEPPLKKGNM